MDKKSFKKRFRYWFDNQMSKGTSMMVAMLAAATLCLVIVIATVIQLCGLAEEGSAFTAFWDILASMINAWMPYSDEGGIGYILLTAISAIVGLFFTSFLIGIISSAVEDRLGQLRKGNSVILEEGHIVILGYKEGEYELIKQMVLAAEDKPTLLVVAEDLEKDEMEEQIKENVELPGNVRLICRHADTQSSASLECCSIPDASLVIVNPVDNAKTIKTLLAVSALLEKENAAVRIVSSVTRREYMLPASMREKKNIMMLHTSEVIARIIAHACTQPGLSEAFTEVFDFNGNEFYFAKEEAAVGMTFAALSDRADGAVPIGILRGGEVLINPEADETVQADDEILIFAENRNAMTILGKTPAPASKKAQKFEKKTVIPERLAIIGANEVFSTIISELPSYVEEIILAGAALDADTSELDALENCKVTTFEGDVKRTADLEELVEGVDHVVLLSDHEMDEEEADMETIMTLVRLRDIKERKNLPFSITAEMRREDDCVLMRNNDYTDFIVSSNLSAMVLSQIAETPKLYSVFHELLSNEGNEFFLKYADEISLCGGEATTREIRAELLSQGYLFLGFIKNEAGTRTMTINPPLDQTFTLGIDDQLVILGDGV